MIKSSYLPFLLAGLLAAAGAHAQSTAVTEAPVQSKDAVRQDAQGMGAAAATSSVAPKAGEASTVTQGKPNIDPNAAPRALTRQEVVAELMGSRANFEAQRRAMRSSGVKTIQ
jgi:hypothetical protein